MNLNILKTLAADIRDFEEQVKSGNAGLRAADGKDASRSTVQPTAAQAVSSEPRFYVPNPLNECTNALGHLADPWSVVRITARVSAAQACGLTGPSLTAQGELWEASPSCVSLARLGSGDQTVVFPNADAVTWLPAARVHEMKLMKRRVPNTPADALMVCQLSVPRKGPAATPWLLDHLGLPEATEFDLHRVLASMKPVHQAVFMAAISRPDIEHKLKPVNEESNSAQFPHPLATGIRAAMGLHPTDLDRDEASLVRLACLISDLGCMRKTEPPTSDHEANLFGQKAPNVGGLETRCAHPQTASILHSLINRFEELEPQDAADLRALLGTEAHRPYRMGSKHGPFGERPVDPDLARMGCALGDALSTAWMSIAHTQPPLVNGSGQGSEQTVSLVSAPPTSVSAEETSVDATSGISTPLSGPGEKLQGAGSPRAAKAADDSSEGSAALAIIAHEAAFAMGDLHFDLERFHDKGDAPRPSLEWAAGMLDGDGCIAIIKQPFQHRKPIYRLIVSICQNCLQTLEHFRRCVGVEGPIYAVKRKLEHNKQVYNLNYSGPKALLVIRRLRAYLVRKRPEALVAISFCLNGQISRRFGPHGVPAAVEAVRVSHYLKLRALK